jgi:hypothetical protein
LTQHYTHGVEQHPVTVWLFQSLGGLPTVPPDFDNLVVLLQRRREELIAILKKSIASQTQKGEANAHGSR